MSPHWLSGYQNKETEISPGFHAGEEKGQNLGQLKEECVFWEETVHISDNLSGHLVAETGAETRMG